LVLIAAFAIASLLTMAAVGRRARELAILRAKGFAADVEMAGALDADHHAAVLCDGAFSAVPPAGGTRE
jgi:hypothetical protein